MDQREHVRLEIENTRAALADKIVLLEDRVTAVKERVMAVKERVRRSVDVRYQVRRHPWRLFGASVVTGIIVGYLTA